LLADGQTITTIEILNLIEHGLHPGCIPEQARPFPQYLKHQPLLNAHNGAILRPKLPAKRPQKSTKHSQKTRKRPQIQESGRFVKI